MSDNHDLREVASIALKPTPVNVSATLAKVDARKQFNNYMTTMAMLAPFLDANDARINEMAAKLEEKQDREAADALVELFDCAQAMATWHDSAAEVLRSGAARVMVMLARAATRGPDGLPGGGAS
jgi:hypothetical protein